MIAMCLVRCQLVLISLCLYGTVTGAHAAEHTLDTLFQKALGHDAQLRAARLELAAAEARVDQADAARLPQVSLTGNTQHADQQLNYEGGLFRDRSDRFNAHGYKLQVTQPLFRLADRAQREAVRAQVERQRAEVTITEMALLGRLSQAFFEACHFGEVFAAAQAEVARYQAESEALQARVNKGDATEFEALMAQADMKQARAKRHEAQVQRAQRLNMIDTLVGQAIDQSSLACNVLALREPEGSVEAWIESALQQSPQLQSGRMALKAAQAQLDQAEGAHWFTVDLVASNSLSRQGPTASVDVGNQTRTTAIGLEVSVPVFNGGALNAKQREAAAQWGKVAAELDGLGAALRVEVGANWATLASALAHRDALLLRAQALALQADALRKRWDLGVGKESDVRVAQQDLARTRGELLRHEGEAMQAYIKLWTLAGRTWIPTQTVTSGVTRAHSQLR